MQSSVRRLFENTDAPASRTSARADWHPAKRVWFRFVFAYLVLYSLPFPIGYVPGTDWLEKVYRKASIALLAWVGKHLLHLTSTISTEPNGSGDTTYNYVEVLCFVGLALLGALVWSIVDAKRPHYDTLRRWLRVYVRYLLAYTMLSYGLSKVFKLQFPFPSPMRLAEPYGESSPMGLLWAFMGYSTGYTVFAGASEVLGGMLLFFRRTTTLGAIVVAAVMLNVVMLNFCYDVPVKLYSSHLLLMAIFLVAPDLGRLGKLLLFNRPVEPANADPLLTTVWANRVALGLKVLFIGCALVTMTKHSWEALHKRGDLAPRPPLAGLYEVEEFIRNRETRAPLTTDAIRWRRVGISGFGGFTAFLMTDSPQRFSMTDDAAKKTLTLSSRQDENKKFVLVYQQPDADHLIVQGDLQGNALTVRLRKIDQSKMLLVSRGFHWINEVPFNR